MQLLPRSLILLSLLVTSWMTTTQLASSAPATDAPGSWKWPLPVVGSASEAQGYLTPVILEPYDQPEFKWSPGHRGIDLKGNTPEVVTAPAAGRVSYRGTVVDRPVLSLDHGNGYVSSFEPISSELKVGDRVSQGQAVGTIATGGHCTIACLHWGVRLNGEYVDPMLFVVDTRPSILLPWVSD